MSILGYSSAYFLPQYWANTPLYGEKIIPLLDYVLSTDYQYTDKLASAFYDIESKYKNTADLPIDKIEAIIEESGYKYIRDLLGQDEDSLRLLVYLLVLIHELKGSKKGIETVLELLRTKKDSLELHLIGDIDVTNAKVASGFTVNNYISYSNFTVGTNPFELTFSIKTSDNYDNEQCIASSPNYGFYIGLDTEGRIVLKVGEVSNSSGLRAWQRLENRTTNVSNKVLEKNTEYTIKFSYTGSEYEVVVIDSNNKSYIYLDLPSTTGLSITGGSLLIGIDGSTGDRRYPFTGEINLAPLAVSANNVVITQWYEKFPVGEEDTYTVEADVDVNLMSSNFFVQFARFAERYVYPSLEAFKAKMALKAEITFLPWVRQKITYIASNVQEEGYETFDVIREDSTQNRQPYLVREPILYAWGYNNEYVYTKSTKIYPATKLYNSDGSTYTGSNFKVEKTSDEPATYEVTYQGEPTTHDESRDIYSGTPYMTKKDTD